MKYVIALAAIFFLAVLGASIMPDIRLLDASPDLVLIFAVSWTVLRGQGEALVVVPLAGLLRDVTSSDPIGTSVLGLLPIVLLWTLKDIAALESKFLPALFLVALGSLIYSVVTMLVLAATGQSVPLLAGLMRVVFPGVLINTVFTPVVYFPLNWLNPAPRPGLPGFARTSSL